ncbi:FxsA family protein [Roseibium sp. RKSG952]|uniref:FxsA family protein n=1 Tax=Roseibium sp. RKSG952 TaxID=2529384 RepID=UPI0013CB39DB|nr:FxsA family protein [Roseibium sp. RKSG952]
MAPYVIAAIVLLPLIEIAVFIAVGEAIGILPTILLTVATAFAGSVMLRQQGLSLVKRMQNELNSGRVPADDIMHGALMVLASLLLLIPGFVTDAVGLLLFIPGVRKRVAKFIVARSNVVIVENGYPRPRGDHVVDLDDADWSAKDQNNDPRGQTNNKPEQLSPWSENDRKPN